MKPGWERKKLGEVCDIYLGKTPYRKKSSLWDKEKMTDNVWITIADMNNAINGVVIDSKEYISDEGAKQCNIVKKGTLLLSFKLTIGRLAFAGRDLYTNEAIASLIIKDEKLLNKFYLYMFLQAYDWDKATEGDMKIKGKTLNKSKLQNLIIQYPPLAEQKQIVKTLDKLFALIDKAMLNIERNIQNIQELFQSELDRIFTQKGDDWKEKKLKEIGTIQTGTTPKTSEKENYGNFIPFIKPADVDFFGDGNLRFDNDGLSEIGLNKGRLIPRKSVLMVCIGSTIGKVGFTVKEITCNQQINVLTPKREFEAKIFYYAMKTFSFRNKVIRKGKGAQATLPIINKTKWENLTIRYPKEKVEQQALVCKFDQLSYKTQKLEAIYRQKLSCLEELKKSILDKAFRGELRYIEEE